MRALLIFDMQNDFMPGGTLAVSEADKLVPLINRLMERFPLVVATKDWHPEGHVSFESLWPVHCVQNTKGAEFVQGLHEAKIDRVIYKGTDPLVDSYSAFFDNEKKGKTELEDYLRAKGVHAVTLVGVAAEYCVLYSALDAKELGFEVTVVTDGVKPIDAEGGRKAFEKMRREGIHLVLSKEVVG